MKLELKGITKRFGFFTANNKINLTVNHGEIHGLLGENGAGKSTLMNTIYGIHSQDEGEILIDDVPVKFNGPGDAVAAGIGMVHQHFMLIPVFTVAESVALGYEPTKKLGILDIKKARQKIIELSDKFNFEIDPDAYIKDLPVGTQQRVEIIKALSRNATILILDEPTAVLTPQETNELMEIMKQLKANGTSIVFITHKLREIKAIADKITVIRMGKIVGEADPKASESELAAAMVGRNVDLNISKKPSVADKNVFEIKNLSLIDNDNIKVLDDISFSVKNGEILAIAGVQGNGQTELTEVIAGLTKVTNGKIFLNSKDITKFNVKKRLDAGLGYIPEDRSKDGVISSFSVAKNMFLDLIDKRPYSNGLSINLKTIENKASILKEEFDIRLNDIHDPISSLSGGNQQKVVLAREFNKKLQLLVASQPTRGVDVGSIEFIHKKIVEERDKGIPIIIISTELDEVYSLADKIAVMYKGKIVGILPNDTPRNILGLMMVGFSYDEAKEKIEKNS